MRRREFLLAGGTVLLAGTGAGWLGWRRYGDDRWRLGAGGREVIASLRGTTPLADEVRDELAAEGLTPEEVERRLLRRLGLEDTPEAAAGEFAARLAAAVREDFAARRLCRGSGWIVTETECLAAVLHWLMFPQLREAAAGPAEFAEGQIATVLDWGPRGTEENTPFNVQRDGHSGIWIRVDEAPPWVKFEIGGLRASTHYSRGVIATGLYDRMQDAILPVPGEYPVALVDEMAGVRQPFGMFVVRPRPPRLRRADGTESIAFCEIGEWGPQETVTGLPSNPQADGGEGLWVRTACAPRGVRLVFGGSELRTVVAVGVVTASVPLELLGVPGDIKVELRDPATGETVTVGHFRIADRLESGQS